MNEKNDEMSPNLVNTVFRLYHLPDDVQKKLAETTDKGNGVHVALLGSIPELGDWKLGRQLMAKPSSSNPKVWEVTAFLPACVTFELSWLVADGNRKVLYWDPSEDHSVRLSYHDALIQVSWSRDPTYFISRTCKFIAQTHYSCPEGQSLALIGSAPCLGAWKPEKRVLANEFPRGSGNWQALTQVASGCQYEWKWVVVDSKNRIQRWEECPNRFVSTNCERLVIKASWHLPSIITSHSQKIYEHQIDINKVSKFYDAVENCESLVSKEMQHVTSTWKKRRETGETPFVVTEVEREAEKEAKGKQAQKLKSKRSFIRNVGRVVFPLTNFLLDCYRCME